MQDEVPPAEGVPPLQRQQIWRSGDDANHTRIPAGISADLTVRFGGVVSTTHTGADTVMQF